MSRRPVGPPVHNQSARRAAKILKLLGESGRPLGLTEIGQKLSLHPSTTHRILAALVAEGLVEQYADTRKYGVSVHLYALGRAALRHLGIQDRVLAELRMLAKRAGET